MNIELAGTFWDGLDGELHQGCRSTACRSNNRQRPGARLSNSLGVRFLSGTKPECLCLWPECNSFVSLRASATVAPRVSKWPCPPDTAPSYGGSEVSLWEPSLAQPCSAEGAFPLGHCSSRTCRSPAGSHRSCSSRDCRHRDNVCASAPHNNRQPGLLMSGLGHPRRERSCADADSNKLFHPSERCVKPASWNKPRQGARCLADRPGTT